MGTWGIGLFEDDITMDVKDYFDDFIEKNNNVIEVCDKILGMFREEIEDKDEGLLIYFALAELQMERGILDSIVKEKCLEYLRSGSSMDRWVKSGIFQFFKRRGVLKKFSKRLKTFANVKERKSSIEKVDDEETIVLKYTVYILEDNNSQPRYVGKTSVYEKRKQYMENIFKDYRSKVAEQ